MKKINAATKTVSANARSSRLTVDAPELHGGDWAVNLVNWCVNTWNKAMSDDTKATRES